MLKNVRDADLHLLRVFSAVAECAGIAAAQDRLNVAPSTISTQISNLETRLGLRLCERGRSGFALTAEGEVVLAAAYRLFRDVGQFVTSVEEVKGKLIGTVRIVVLDNIVLNPQLHLNAALAALRNEQPLLRFDIHQLPAGQLENAVLRREADIGVSWIASELTGLSHESIFEEQQVICCGRGHALYDRAPHDIEDEDLENADWVRRGYRMPKSFPFAVPPLSTAVAYHMEGIAHFILAGTHIGYLPKHFAEHWLESGAMRLVRPRKHSLRLDFRVITRADATSNPVISAVRTAVVDAHRENQA